jgi:hypothetical protein
MLKKLAILMLAVGLGGCGTEEEDKQMLIAYVAELKKLDEKNERIVRTIEHLRKPISEISERNLVEARQLINDYVAQLQTLPQDLPYRELRLTHNLYVEKVSQSIELSGDKGREMKREKSNVDIGVRHIEKFTKRHHNGMSVLWERHRLPDFPLEWPQ